MNWTKEKPKKPGIYWMMYSGSKPEIVGVWKNWDGFWLYESIGSDYKQYVKDTSGTWWYGPLEPPYFPK